MKEYYVLVANNHLDSFGGSETFTYTLVKELKLRGIYVEYFTFKKGSVSDYIENLGVRFFSRKSYDLILANHNTCVSYLYKYGPIIQTCHGIYPKLESPSSLANQYVAISKEIQDHLKQLEKKSTVILNGIDFKRYRCKKNISRTLKKVLSLAQSDKANEKIKAACDQLNIDFYKLDKNDRPKWHVEDAINNVDLVIGLGRSVYEAIACSRPVIIYDERHYSGSCADGYLTANLVEKCISKNFSGRYKKLELTIDGLVGELRKYNYTDGELLKEKVKPMLDVQKKVDEYLFLAKRMPSAKKALSVSDIFNIFNARRKAKKSLPNFLRP